MPSIKLLNISLVLLCICTTAFLCTFLAITSSEKALKDTKGNRDDSISSSFAVGEESVKNRTVEYLDVLMGSTVEFLRQFTLSHRLASVSQAKEIMAAPWDMVKQWDWHRKPRYFYAFDLLRREGNTAIGFMLKNRLMIIDLESFYTVSNPSDGYHSLEAILNYGDDHPWGGLNRSFSANTNDGYPIGVTNPLTDVNWINNATYPCVSSDVATQGTRPDDPCILPEFADPPTMPNYVLSTFVPLNHTLWTPPLPIAGFLTINCFTPISHNGERTGFASSGADLRHVSQHLSSLQIGGPVDGHPSRGRVFVTLRGTWYDPQHTLVGKMVGASHGRTITTIPGTTVSTTLYPSQSSDHIISSVANATIAEGLDLNNIMVSNDLTVLNITTDLAPEGEEFYYRVGVLSDEYGVDWYVHLVIDRAYILGSIDRKLAETRGEIKVSEKKVDDDLQRARITLYVSVVTVTVMLTILSVVLVLRIIKPLVVLEREMAAVAVMRLEAVNTRRPLSSLREVRLMQVSFLQMIRNLVEYRNYMPASVLQDDIEDETSAQEQQEASSTDASNTRTSGGSSGGTKVAKAPYLHTSDIRTKRVTLMACNIVGFLKVGTDAQKIQSLLSKYLTAGLHHLKTSKGIPDSFSGDRLYASWNGVRTCSSHRVAAYQCAKEMCNDKTLGLHLSIGLVSGDVKCGNMGCEGMKKYSYIGSLSSWVHVVERIGRSMECEVAIDGVVNEEVCNKAYTRMLQHVVFKKHSGKVLRVYEAMEHKEVAAEEWMYQLREGDSNDPNKAYNSSYELFMEGRVEEAGKEVAHFDDGSRLLEVYKARLARAADNRALCEPLGKDDPLYN